jgi:hypothetical protein
MNLNRRDVIRRSGLFAAAATLGLVLPARTWAALPVPTGSIKADEDLLNAIGDTILPTTPSSPGAGAVGIGRFILAMTSECLTPESAEALRQALAEMRASPSWRNFENQSAMERETLLRAYERTTGIQTAGSVINGYRLIKELTLLGYFTSEAGATQALRYDPVPGFYRGSVRLEDGDRSWST